MEEKSLEEEKKAEKEELDEDTEEAKRTAELVQKAHAAALAHQLTAEKKNLKEQSVEVEVSKKSQAAERAELVGQLRQLLAMISSK